MKNAENHPCYSAEAKHKFARVHLPVAPRCNIQCNYCNRSYDCVNESRPGVTSAVLTPAQALEYVNRLNGRMDNLSVVGIAGPGDPFANPRETMDTLRLIHEAHPDKVLCLSSNGLNIEPYAETLAQLGVHHVTLTINATDPDILGQIYAWARHDKIIYRGKAAGMYLLEKQLSALKKLVSLGITVKVNTIVLPGINDHHIVEVAQTVSALGAKLMNPIALYPTRDTPFETLSKPTEGTMKKVKETIKPIIEPMTHCARCRADAAGMLGKDSPEAMTILKEVAAGPLNPQDNRPFVAVATYEGIMVNQHLGEALELYIFRQTPNGYNLEAQRPTPHAGSGDVRWLTLARTLKDCRALLVSGIGPTPEEILSNCGIKVVQMSGMIDEGLDGIFMGKPIRSVPRNQIFKCGSNCKGNATGCA